MRQNDLYESPRRESMRRKTARNTKADRPRLRTITRQQQRAMKREFGCAPCVWGAQWSVGVI